MVAAAGSTQHRLQSGDGGFHSSTTYLKCLPRVAWLLTARAPPSLSPELLHQARSTAGAAAREGDRLTNQLIAETTQQEFGDSTTSWSWSGWFKLLLLLFHRFHSAATTRTLSPSLTLQLGRFQRCFQRVAGVSTLVDAAKFCRARRCFLGAPWMRPPPGGLQSKLERKAKSEGKRTVLCACLSPPDIALPHSGPGHPTFNPRRDHEPREVPAAAPAAHQRRGCWSHSVGFR